MSANELKSALHDLYISAARELEVDTGRKVSHTLFEIQHLLKLIHSHLLKKAVVIFVPFRQLKDFHKIQTRLVRELEKVSSMISYIIRFIGCHLRFWMHLFLFSNLDAAHRKLMGF